MGDFNAQPWSIPIAILRTHAGLSDSFQNTHPNCEDPPSPGMTQEDAIVKCGKSCDSSLNTWSADKNISKNIQEAGGKRLDYIFFRQPAAVRRRLINQARGNETNGASSRPVLRCISSEVMLTELVPGESFSYSDHFALFSTFIVDSPELVSVEDTNGSLPEVELVDTKEKEDVIRRAAGIARDYRRLSARAAKTHWYTVYACVLALIGLTVGSAWQPKSWLQPIFTLLGGLAGVAGATFLYFGFVWGRWEQGLITETIESMDLELQVMRRNRS